MTRSRFSQTTNPPNKSSSGAISIVQMVILGISITTMAAIFVQNLQPAVQIVFLGQKISLIPLSVAMLGAFIIGGFIAFGFNAIATWRHNLAIRRALANRYGTDRYSNDQIKADQIKYEDEEYDDDIYEEDEDSDTVPYGDRPPLDAKYTKEN